MEPGQVICPFNKAHVIDAPRLQVHLIKCRKNYPDDLRVNCPFNTTHIVASSELDHHTKNCANAPFGLVNMVSYDVDTGFQPPPILTQAIPTSTNWDNIDVPTYEPSLENRTVIRCLKGAPPSERKHFRVEERKRLSSMQESVRSSQQSSRASSCVGDSKLKPIRKPTSSSQSVISVKSNNSSTKTESQSWAQIKKSDQDESEQTKENKFGNVFNNLEDDFPSLNISMQNKKKNKGYSKEEPRKMTMAERIKQSSEHLKK